jgi:hypothetical protein
MHIEDLAAFAEAALDRVDRQRVVAREIISMTLMDLYENTTAG